MVARMNARTRVRTHARTHVQKHACISRNTHAARTQAIEDFRSFRAAAMSQFMMYVRAWTNARTCARTDACAHARTHARTHARMHACTHARTHACTHTRAHGRAAAYGRTETVKVLLQARATVDWPVLCHNYIGHS